MHPANPPKTEDQDKYVEKVFNWSEVHLYEMNCYKIYTLAPLFIYVVYECPLSQIMFALRGDANLQSVIKIYSDTKVIHPKYYKHLKKAAQCSWLSNLDR